LDFKWSKYLWLFTSLIIFLFIAISSWPDKEAMFFGGAFGGFFTGAAIFIIFSVSESENRETWPEKLALTDLIFRGKGGVKEVGIGILHGIGLMGASILIFGILGYIAGKVGLIIELFDSDSLWFNSNLQSMISKFSVGFVTNLFPYFIFISFIPTFLKSRLQSRSKYYFLMVLILSLSCFHPHQTYPYYIFYLLLVPIALLWTYAIRNYSSLTIFIAFMGALTIHDLRLIALHPRGLLSTMSLALGSLLLLTFIISAILSFSKRKAEEHDSYMPEYICRIAEKERFARELEIARTVQLKFLPQSVPHFDKLEIASFCRPAREVGGDYYDFIKVGDRFMNVLIGDVSGKGVSAAFYMTMIKGIIKTLSRSNLSPSELLARANEIFYENVPRNIFVSIIYGMFDMEKGRFTFASAGHNPLIIHKKQKSGIDTINPKGIALGLDKGDFFSEVIKEASVSIEDRDVYIFYTDGISEAMNSAGEIFGEDRLCDLVDRNAHFSANRLQSTIIEEVDKFTGKALQHDDITLVVVKVKKGKVTA